MQIVQVASDHFKRQEPLLLLVDSEKARDYIDKLLWSQPKESFLPHSGELITIAMEPCQTINNYFNLTQNPLIGDGYSRIYEFDDQSSPEKQSAFKRRYMSYRENAYPIATL